MTTEARVVALDRLWLEDITSRSGDLLDVVFGWADFTRLGLLTVPAGLVIAVLALWVGLRALGG